MQGALRRPFEADISDQLAASHVLANCPFKTPLQRPQVLPFTVTARAAPAGVMDPLLLPPAQGALRRPFARVPTDQGLLTPLMLTTAGFND
jgi:hypothetical protein